MRAMYPFFEPSTLAIIPREKLAIGKKVSVFPFPLTIPRTPSLSQMEDIATSDRTRVTA